MAPPEACDAIVVGGGFFGCELASYLAKSSQSVCLLEREKELLQRASYVNQARVHNGYHYPRHLLTALRSRVNFPRFVREYKACIVDDFDKYYAIARRFSKVNAAQFQAFMERTEAPTELASPSVTRLFNPDLVEAVFRVTEYAFDAVKLKELLSDRLEAAKVKRVLGAEARRVERDGDAGLRLWYRNGESAERSVRAKRVFNCAYSNINQLLHGSGLELIPLKHEIAEMCLIELPPELRNLSVTVMCGPFFSFMPFPPRGLNTLSHVRYTPHCYWYDQGTEYSSPYEYFNVYERKSRFPAIIRDVARYIPSMHEAVYKDSIWEVKTTLPSTEQNDGRPILYRRDHGIQGLTCVMGGKIDNMYDAQAEIDRDLEVR
jgi:glycine/D-amino acid oxidase-like deaminating enzyme